jgi:kynureninase
VTLDHAALDAADPLASFAARFARSASDAVFVDGNSLGPPLLAARTRANALLDEWGRELTAGWEHWVDLPLEVGDRLGAACLGAGPGQVVVCDSTSINIVKAVSALADGRRLVVAADEFPTDRYLLQGLAARNGAELLTVPTGADVIDACAQAPSIALVSVVHYRSGELLDVATGTAAAHAAGSDVVWDLSHAAGVVPLQLDAWGVRLAVGCTYKYLNSGPGAPGYVFVAHHVQPELRQPLWGWFGQRDQFAMGERYEPADGIRSWLVGTPNILATAIVDENVAVIAEAGIDAIRAKSERLVALAEHLAEASLVPQGWRIVTPRDSMRRGGHLSVARSDAKDVCASLIAADRVVADFRAPDVLRLGFSPLPTSFADVAEAIRRVSEVPGAPR